MTSANGDQQEAWTSVGPNPADLSLPGALEGLRVLEICDEKGQFCGKLMADNGADLIKIEPPGGEGLSEFWPLHGRRSPPRAEPVLLALQHVQAWHNPEPRDEAGAGHPQAVGGHRRHRPGKLQARLPGFTGVGVRRAVCRQPQPDHVLAHPLRPDRPLAGLRQQRHHADGRRRADGLVGL